MIDLQKLVAGGEDGQATPGFDAFLKLPAPLFPDDPVIFAIEYADGQLPVTDNGLYFIQVRSEMPQGGPSGV